ncbi:hypothetical protein [Methanobrevibacter millerae]|uniref:Adhesin-like protein n=1 Tax=Methanobrevibacter millerae TaxID=230361 RepID=A0A1G5X2G4_9EURY|nr:hypothetical protein [Methanobrevibacter millerae]SDA64126.1 hypothetical protein SAMN02910315_01871 [Methanobrevibacter millerae]
MKKIGLFLILLILFISIGCVYADGNLTSLQKEVNEESDSLILTQDYALIHKLIMV